MLSEKTIGLVLSGGGARGAYQAGALKGMWEILSSHGVKKNPFKVIVGTSAGAINGAYLASIAHDIGGHIEEIVQVWDNLEASKVFHTNPLHLGLNSVKWIRDLSFGPLTKNKWAVSLLDTGPLQTLLRESISFYRIQKNIQEGHLDFFSVAATDYATTKNVVFISGVKEIDLWQKQHRITKKAEIGLPHVMASSAIPVFFPPIQVEDRFFGDGCLRNSSPLSPAIKMGAEKIIMIGVRSNLAGGSEIEETYSSPSFAKVLGNLLNSVFLDSLDFDLERLKSINKTVSLISPEVQKTHTLRPIETFYLHPSRDVRAIAYRMVDDLPILIKHLLQGLGPLEEAVDIVSYLLFDSSYCRCLTELGYKDIMDRKEDFLKFLSF